MILSVTFKGSQGLDREGAMIMTGENIQLGGVGAAERGKSMIYKIL